MPDFLDEAFLKIVALIVRFFQIAASIVTLSCVADAISNISNSSTPIPQRYAAVVAISAMTALWSLLALLLTCCAGSILLGIETLLDGIAVALSIVSTVLLNSDALSSTDSYVQQYPKYLQTRDAETAQDLIRVAFIFSIIQIPLFLSTSLVSWSVFLIRRRGGHHHHHHHHSPGHHHGYPHHGHHHHEDSDIEEI